MDPCDLLTIWSASLAKVVSSSFSERDCILKQKQKTKKDQEETEEKKPGIDFQFPNTHIKKQTCIYVFIWEK